MVEPAAELPPLPLPSGAEPAPEAEPEPVAEPAAPVEVIFCLASFVWRTFLLW